MQVIQYLLLCSLLLGTPSIAFSPSRAWKRQCIQYTVTNTRSSPLFASEDPKLEGSGEKNGVVSVDSGAVDFVLEEVSRLLQGSGPSDRPETDEKEVLDSFGKIFDRIRGDSGLTQV